MPSTCRHSVTPSGRKKASSTYADKAKAPASPKKPLKRLKYMKFVTGHPLNAPILHAKARCLP
jgi:hypothetical protein